MVGAVGLGKGSGQEVLCPQSSVMPGWHPVSQLCSQSCVFPRCGQWSSSVTQHVYHSAFF